MARGRRSAAAEEEEQDVEVEAPTLEDGLERLQFKEPLSWRAGKPIATEMLHTRLNKLAKELGNLEQETTDASSLTQVAKELASQQLIMHKDKGIRAFTASCLVDVLRICAPNAPFSPAQLKDIFKLFVTYIVPALFDPTNTYNSEHRHVLNSFAEVKSIALLADLDGNESLMLQLFTNIFDGISAPKSASGERITKDAENDLVEVMTTLIEEAQGLPSKLIDAIFAQFLRGVASTGKRRRDAADLDDGQSTLLLKEEPPAYQMAKTICNNSVDKMSRYVTQYFSDVLLEASGLGGAVNGHDEDDSDDEDGPAGPSASDLDQLQKAHLLLRELWRACHPILGTVLSQLDTEIAADNVHLRQLATETLGDMIAGIGAAGPPPLPSMDPAAYPPLKMSDDVSQTTATSVLTTPLAPVSFAQTHSGVYHNFVNRRMDKSSAIRAAWATAVGYILSTSAGGIGLSREDEDLFIEGLGEKLADADEKVRLAAIKAIETFQFRDVITKLAAGGGIDKQGSLLGNLADRCRDKKSSVRVEAMALLASLWGVGTGELLANNAAVVAALGNVPSHIFNSFYVGDQHLNVLVDRVTFECLIPLSFPAMKKAAKATNGSSQSQSQNASQSASDQDAIRAERILLLVRGLDERAKQAFFVIQGRQPQFATVLETLIRQCEAYNGGVMDENSERIVAGLNKSIQYISKYLPDEAKTTVDLHKFAKLNDRRNYNLIRWVIGQDNDFKSVHRGIKELVKRLQTSKDPTILDTMLPLLYRSGCIMLNRSHLSTIMSVSKTNKDGLGAVAHDFLSQISQRNPDLFKTQLAELCKDLINGAPTADRANDPGVVDSLKACSSYAQKYPKDINLERKFVQTMMDFALYGQPPKAAKYAVNILLCKKDNKSMVHATDLLQRVMKDWSYGSSHFLNKLMAVSQLELLAPKVTADAEDDILDMAVQQILLEVRKEGTDRDPDWVADDDLDEESRAKLIALKILVNRLRSDEGGEETQGKTNAAWKLLRKLVIKEGELCKTKDTPKPTRGRLRLKAAQLMLKLCQQKSYDDLLVADFNQLATVIQAEQVEVRHAFAEKLQKYLATGKLKPRFYTILFLAAFEPVSQYRLRIETWLRSRALSFHRQSLPTMESIMPRLISLLAHHPDYSDNVDDLKDTARYLLFYISNIATEANLGTIAKYAERVKQTNDAIDPQKSDSLRVISDLATAVIRKWQERRNWTFQAFAGKVPLPVGLFSALPSHQVAQEIAERNYLPDGIDEKLDELIRAVEKKKKRKSFDEGGHTAAPAAKKSRSEGTTKAARPATVAKTPKAAAPRKASAGTKAKLPARPKKSAARNDDGSSPPPTGPASSTDRRRSGRATKNASYREASEDDEDDAENVSKWIYMDAEEAEKDRARTKGKALYLPADGGGDSSSEGEDDEGDGAEGDGEEEEAEATPPPRSNGRAAKTGGSSPPKSSAAKTKAKPAAAVRKVSATAAAKTTAKPTRGGKKKAADAFDMDVDSD